MAGSCDESLGSLTITMRGVLLVVMFGLGALFVGILVAAYTVAPLLVVGYVAITIALLVGFVRSSR